MYAFLYRRSSSARCQSFIRTSSSLARYVGVAERAIDGLSSRLTSLPLAPDPASVETASTGLLQAGCFQELIECVRAHAGTPHAIRITPSMRGDALLAAAKAGQPLPDLQLIVGNVRSEPRDSFHLLAEDRCSLVLAFLEKDDVTSALKCWPASSLDELRGWSSRYVSEPDARVVASPRHLAGLGTALLAAVSRLNAKGAPGAGSAFVANVLQLLVNSESPVPPEALPPLLASIVTKEGASAAPHVVALLMESITVAAAAAGQSLAAQLQVVEAVEAPLRQTHVIQLPRFYGPFQVSFPKRLPRFSRWVPFLPHVALVQGTIPSVKSWREERLIGNGAKSPGLPADNPVARGPVSRNAHPVECLVRECVLAAPLPPLVYAHLLRACVVADAPESALQLLAHAETAMLFRRALDRSIGFSGEWTSQKQLEPGSVSLALQWIVSACVDGAGPHAVEKAATSLLKYLSPGTPQGLRYSDIDDSTILSVASLFSRHGRHDDAFSAFRWHVRARAEVRVAPRGLGTEPASESSADCSSLVDDNVVSIGVMGRSLVSARPATTRSSSVPLRASEPARSRLLNGQQPSPVIEDVSRWKTETLTASAATADAGLFSAAKHFRRALASASTMGRSDLPMETAVRMSQIVNFFGLDVCGVSASLGEGWVLHLERALQEINRAACEPTARVERAEDLRSDESSTPWQLASSAEAVVFGRAETYSRFPGAALLTALRFGEMEGGPDVMDVAKSRNLASLSASEASEIPTCSLQAADAAICAMLDAGNLDDGLSLWRALGDRPLRAILDVAKMSTLGTLVSQRSAACLPRVLGAAAHAQPGALAFLAPLQRLLAKVPSVLLRDPPLLVAWLESLGYGPVFDSSSRNQDDALLLAAIKGEAPTALGALVPSHSHEASTAALREQVAMLFHILLLAQRPGSASSAVMTATLRQTSTSLLSASPAVAQAFMTATFRLALEIPELLKAAFDTGNESVTSDTSAARLMPARPFESKPHAVLLPPGALYIPGRSDAWPPANEADKSMLVVATTLTRDRCIVDLQHLRSEAILTVLGLPLNTLARFEGGHDAVATQVRSCLSMDVRASDTGSTLSSHEPTPSSGSLSNVGHGARDRNPSVLLPLLAEIRDLAPKVVRLRRAFFYAYALPAVACSSPRQAKVFAGSRELGSRAVDLDFWATYALLSTSCFLIARSQSLIERLELCLSSDLQMQQLSLAAQTLSDDAVRPHDLERIVDELNALRKCLLLHTQSLYSDLLRAGHASALDGTKAHELLVQCHLGLTNSPVVDTSTACSLATLREQETRKSSFALRRGVSLNDRASSIVAAAELVESVLKRCCGVANFALVASALRAFESIADALFEVAGANGLAQGLPASAHVVVSSQTSNTVAAVPSVAVKDETATTSRHSAASLPPNTLHSAVYASLARALTHLVDSVLLTSPRADDVSVLSANRAVVRTVTLNGPTIEKLIFSFNALYQPTCSLRLLAALRPCSARPRLAVWPVGVAVRPYPRALLAHIRKFPEGWDSDAAAGAAMKLVETGLTGQRHRDSVNPTIARVGDVLDTPASSDFRLRQKLLCILDTFLSPVFQKPQAPATGTSGPHFADPNVLLQSHNANARKSAAEMLSQVRAGSQPSSHPLFRLRDAPFVMGGAASTPRTVIHPVRSPWSPSSPRVIISQSVSDATDISQLLLLGDAIGRAILSCNHLKRNHYTPLFFAEALRHDAPLPGTAVVAVARWAAATCPELIPPLAEWAACEIYEMGPPTVKAHILASRVFSTPKALGYVPLHLWDLVAIAAAAQDLLAALTLHDTIMSVPGALFPIDVGKRAAARALRELQGEMSRSGVANADLFEALYAGINPPR